MDKIQLWAAAIQHFEGYYPGSRSYRNCNPANFRYTPYIKSLGANGADKQNYAIFPNYIEGFSALCNFLIAACNGELKAYKKTMTLNDFFSVYAPSADKNSPLTYAKFIGSQLKADPAKVQINTLL